MAKKRKKTQTQKVEVDPLLTEERPDLQCPFCHEKKWIYPNEDSQGHPDGSYYCASCDSEFSEGTNTGYTDEPVGDSEWQSYLEDKYKSTVTQKPASTGGQQSFNYASNSLTCTHPPRHVIDGKTWNVYCGKKYDVQDAAPDYDVVLNLSGFSLKERHKIPIPELRKWENPGGQVFTEVLIDWPDYGIPNLPKQFWVDLVDYLKTKKAKMLVLCLGGHGRTGTAVASLMVVGLGYTPWDAIDWIRNNYCDEAIESTRQEQYIEDLRPDLPRRSSQAIYETKKDALVVCKHGKTYNQPCPDCQKDMPHCAVCGTPTIGKCTAHPAFPLCWKCPCPDCKKDDRSCAACGKKTEFQCDECKENKIYHPLCLLCDGKCPKQKGIDGALNQVPKQKLRMCVNDNCRNATALVCEEHSPGHPMCAVCSSKLNNKCPIKLDYQTCVVCKITQTTFRCNDHRGKHPICSQCEQKTLGTCPEGLTPPLDDTVKRCPQHQIIYSKLSQCPKCDDNSVRQETVLLSKTGTA